MENNDYISSGLRNKTYFVSGKIFVAYSNDCPLL